MAFRKMGVIDHPYMPIPCLLALSVIPHARITDKGTFDVDNQKFVEPFVHDKGTEFQSATS
jgi:adenine deaminase